MDDYNPIQQSTFALNTFRKTASVEGKKVVVEFWDTAGQNPCLNWLKYKAALLN